VFASGNTFSDAFFVTMLFAWQGTVGVRGKVCNVDFVEIDEQSSFIIETSSIAISELSLTPLIPTKAN